MNSTLSSRTVLLTGTTSGIGLATAEMLCAAGARVLGLGRNREKLDQLTARWGERFEAICADLADREERRRVVELLLTRNNAADVFVNNAGACVFSTPLDTDPRDLSALFEVNVLAGIELARAVAERMTEGAHIVHISSVTARFVAGPNFATYAATKVAAERLIEGLRLELHPKGISVSTILPGLVDTPIYDGVTGFQQARSKLSKQIPKWLAPGDIGEIIIWLLRQPDHVVISEVMVLPKGQAR